MLDFDAGKLLIIGLVALVVIGPKDLPRVLRQVGQAVGKLRRMASEFQGQFMDAMKEADLQDLKAEIAKLKDSAKLDVDFDPARDLKHEMTSVLDKPAPVPVAAPHTVAVASPETGVLPAPAAIEPEATLASAGIGPITELPALSESEAAASSMAAFAGVDASSEVPAFRPDPRPLVADSPAVRRRIVVTRRRSLSRLDGAVVRAAMLAGRSRTILPARPDTADR